MFEKEVVLVIRRRFFFSNSSNFRLKLVESEIYIAVSLAALEDIILYTQAVYKLQAVQLVNCM